MMLILLGMFTQMVKEQLVKWQSKHIMLVDRNTKMELLRFMHHPIIACHGGQHQVKFLTGAHLFIQEDA
ncbi:hypothetical protein YA47_15985 [Enterobacter asburiae]|nr:hypothetical protein YA47_15985 [Enterobacter asburiae]